MYFQASSTWAEFNSYCSYVVLSMNTNMSPWRYRNWAAISVMSAASSESPPLYVRSSTVLRSRLRSLHLYRALPLPGLTKLHSIIKYGSPSI